MKHFIPKSERSTAYCGINTGVFLWKSHLLHLAIIWAMQREIAHWKKKKRAKGHCRLHLSPLPIPQTKLKDILLARGKVIYVKMQTSKPSTAHLSLENNEGSLSYFQSWQGVAGNEGWLASPPSCWSFWANTFRKTYPPCHWPGKPGKGSIRKQKGLFRDG